MGQAFQPALDDAFQTATGCLFSNSPLMLIVTFSTGMRLPARAMPFSTTKGRPWQQGTSITTTVIFLMSAARKMSANFWI